MICLYFGSFILFHPFISSFIVFYFQFTQDNGIKKTFQKKVKKYRMQSINQNKFVFFMILMNYSSLISPSPSLSASSIISCNYSSAIVSPNYLETLFKFFNEIFPVLSSSKSLNALRISSLGSLSLIFVVISSIKSANSITPFPSLSTSAMSFLTSYFFGKVSLR